MVKRSWKIAVLLFPRAPWPAVAETYTGKVVAIANGNTLTLLVGRKQIKVRLAEIDAPSVSSLRPALETSLGVP